jgi:uncharacterized membrane protein
MDGESSAVPGAPASAPTISPQRGLVEYTYLIYALHALTVLSAFLTMRVPVLRFAFCLPSLAAIIMNYLRRHEAQGTWLESHFTWQIRTFWYAWLWTVVTSIVAIPLLLVGVNLWISLMVFVLIVLWVLYRVVRGALALREARPSPVSMV